MSNLAEVKRSLSISEFDTEKDALLIDLMSRVNGSVCSYIGEAVVPEVLNWVVVEATIARFNRIGSEGMSAQNIEGNNTTYTTEDTVVNYYSHLDIWVRGNKVASNRRVRFL